MNSPIMFAVYLTKSAFPAEPVAVFTAPDKALDWARKHYEGSGWEVRPVYSVSFSAVTPIKEGSPP